MEIVDSLTRPLSRSRSPRTGQAFDRRCSSSSPKTEHVPLLSEKIVQKYTILSLYTSARPVGGQGQSAVNVKTLYTTPEIPLASVREKHGDYISLFAVEI